MSEDERGEDVGDDRALHEFDAEVESEQAQAELTRFGGLG